MKPPAAAEVQPFLYSSLRRLESWVLSHDWKGYDTFDGLASPLARPLTFGNRFLAQCWQQGVRRFPINLRPLLGIRPGMSSKGMGFFARGYLRLHTAHGDARDLEQARFCLRWLLEHPSPGYQGLSWGNHFDYAHRAGRIPKGTPTVVWTGLIGHAFLDAYEKLGEPAYLEAAREVCRFIATDLGHDVFDADTAYIRYYPGATHLVHNSSMIGASLLARTYRHAPDAGWLQLARQAVRWTVRHQLPNGAWHYGVGDFKWVDSFHTGYVLDALDVFIRSTGDREHEEALRKGYAFYLNTFFEADGTPRYYDTRRSPLDIQCPSQGIETLLGLRRLDGRSVPTAIRVAVWTVRHMQGRDGHFFYRKYPLITNRTATLHWGQATMFSALAMLDEHLCREGAP